MGLFNWKWIADKNERALGVTFRVFGLDVSFMLLGYLNDWRLIDLRVPCERGVFLQLLFAFIAFGRLDNDFYL